MQDFETLSDTHETNIDPIVKEVWGKKIEEVAKSKRVFRPLILFNDELLNKPGKLVHIAQRQELVSSPITEEGTISPTTFSFDEMTTLEPTEHGVAVRISRKAVESSNVPLLKSATLEMGEGVAQEEDSDISVMLSAATANVIYALANGGTASGTADMNGRFYPNLISLGKLKLQQNNYGDDAVLVVSPEQFYSMSTYPQFSDSSVYGSSEFVKEGRIPRFLGVPIYVSNNIQTCVGSADVAGHIGILMDAKKAAAIAVGHNVRVENDYEPLSRKHIITATMSRDQKLLNQDAICLIYTID